MWTKIYPFAGGGKIRKRRTKWKEKLASGALWKVKREEEYPGSRATVRAVDGAWGELGRKTEEAQVGVHASNAKVAPVTKTQKAMAHAG